MAGGGLRPCPILRRWALANHQFRDSSKSPAQMPVPMVFSFPHCGLAVVILAARRGHRRLVAAASARIGFWVASDSERFSVDERRMKAMSARPFRVASMAIHKASPESMMAGSRSSMSATIAACPCSMATWNGAGWVESGRETGRRSLTHSTWPLWEARRSGSCSRSLSSESPKKWEARSGLPSS